MSREGIYDSEIAPLVAQLSDMCDKNGIAHLMTFQIAEPGQSSRIVTTINTVSDDTRGRLFCRRAKMCALLLQVTE